MAVVAFASELRLAPAQLARVQAWLDGQVETPTPRPAATVILLREEAGALETFLMRRASTMRFAPDALVFPGGAVAPTDADAHATWSGPTAAEWSTALGLDQPDARALVTAAARELFEEADLLLATDAGGTPSRTTRARVRADLVEHGRSLATTLAGHSLVLRSDWLRPWARWVTPRWSPKRFDTYFFAAVMPAGGDAAVASEESVHAAWYRVAEAISGAEAGTLPLLTPTLAALRDVMDAGSVEAVMETWRRPARFEGTARRTGDEIRTWVERTGPIS